MRVSLFYFVSIITSVSAFVSISNKVNHSQGTQLYGRKPFITGNWKLNPDTKDEAIALAKSIAAAVKEDSPEVALFVPFPFIELVQRTVGDKITVGAEMVTPEIKGAFTGGISATMLKSIGSQWALAGHSERRTINKETDEYINAQCLRLIENGMSVILCIGETETEYNKNLAGAVCEIQLKKGLAGISAEEMSRVCIAYEPVWAIGTGKVATPEIAQEVHAQCRATLAKMYGKKVAESTRILYGGSVGPDSVDGLMAKPDIDGTLVGGASLDGTKFGRIINFVPTKALMSVGSLYSDE
jgi:triosephosphate isomerase